MKSLTVLGLLATGCVAEYGITPNNHEEQADEGHNHADNPNPSSIAEVNNAQIQRALSGHNQEIEAPIFASLMPQNQYEALTIKFGNVTNSSWTVCQGGYTDDATTFIVICLDGNNVTEKYGNMGKTIIDTNHEIVYYTVSNSETTRSYTVALSSETGESTFTLFDRIF